METLPKSNNPLPATLTKFEGTVQPHLVIKPLVNHVSLPVNANSLQSTNYARAFLEAAIAHRATKKYARLLRIS